MVLSHLPGLSPPIEEQSDETMGANLIVNEVPSDDGMAGTAVAAPLPGNEKGMPERLLTWSHKDRLSVNKLVSSLCSSELLPGIVAARR